MRLILSGIGKASIARNVPPRQVFGKKAGGSGRHTGVKQVITEKFLRNRRGAELSLIERQRLEDAVSEVRRVPPRTTIIRAWTRLDQSTLLVEGTMTRFIDDRKGRRQQVALHLPGDFVDLHAFPLKMLDHSIATVSDAVVAIVPHANLDAITREMPDLARKLWCSTMIDAAMHRAWLFRLGRLDALGRVAHFLCETNMRLMSSGLSDGHTFSLALTQTDIAEVCGLTNIHVNRVVRQMREDGLCNVRPSTVELLDFPRLTARGQFDPAYLYIDPACLPVPSNPREMKGKTSCLK